MGPSWRGEHLLGHIEGVVGVNGARAGYCFQWREVTRRGEELANMALSMTSLYKDCFGYLEQIGVVSK